MMHHNYKCTLFQFNNPIPFKKNVSRNKRWENVRSTIKHPGSVLTEAWSGKSSKTHQFQALHFQPRDAVTCPNLKDFWERHMTSNHKVQASSTFHPLNFHSFSMINFSSHIQFGFPTSAKKECHSELFHGGAASTTHSSTKPVCAIFKYEIAFCSRRKHGKIRTEKLAVSIQIYWEQ